MKRPLAVVFDLDGTLADTRLDIAAACNHTLAALGRPTLAADTIATYVGDGARLLLARTFGAHADDAIVREAEPIFGAYYEAHAAEHASLLDGARSALDACRALPLVLVTNKPRAATLPLLDALGLTARFRVVIAGGDAPLKPDPAGILRALATVGLAGDDAWVVGDGPQDIHAGRAARASTVGVLGGFAPEAVLRAARPDHLLRSLHDFGDLLLSAAPR